MGPQCDFLCLLYLGFVSLWFVDFSKCGHFSATISLSTVSIPSSSRGTPVTHILKQLIFFFFFFGLLRAIPVAYGSSQARSGIRATATGLCQASATPDLSCICDLHHSPQQHRILSPLSKARDEPASSWILVRFVSAEPPRELQTADFVSRVTKRCCFVQSFFFVPYFG